MSPLPSSVKTLEVWAECTTVEGEGLEIHPAELPRELPESRTGLLSELLVLEQRGWARRLTGDRVVSRGFKWVRA